MNGRGPFGTIATLGLGAIVFLFTWSTALYALLGLSLDAVRPWSVFTFIGHYGITANNTQVLAAAFGIALTLATIAAGGLWVLRPKSYYGDARWATRSEIRKARLLEPDGVLLGRHNDQYLRNGEAGHVLVAAPTRSGKGVGIVIPNLLSWPGSVVVLDIKHENYTLTSGFRAQHQPVYKWSPADDDARSHRFNPLSTVRNDAMHRISDLQRLATILLPQPGNSDPMWQNEARDLFLGLALYVLDDPTLPATIGQIYRLLKTELDLSELLEVVLDNDELRLDRNARQSLASFVNKAPKERSGVRSNLTAALNLWANPVIDAATAASDFDLSELRRRPASIYVAVKQNQLGTLAPLLGLFFQQCVDVLGRDLPGPAEPHRVLLLIDEFASLGRLDVIQHAMAFLAGYGVRLVNIVQGLSQLDHHYGAARDTLLQNSAIQIYFAANDDATTRYVSRRLGIKTIQTASRSEPGGFGWATKTTGYAARALMLPEEIRQLKDPQAIIFKEGARPALVKKIRYFRDRELKRRLLLPAPVPTLDLTPPPALQITVNASRNESAGPEDPIAIGKNPDSATKAEIAAMGCTIADLMADDPDPAASYARAELLAALGEEAEQ